MTASFRQKYVSLRPDALVVLWLAVWWVCNLVQAGFTELAHDEAYYHMFAQNLAWGYFDHPPMTAMLVRLGALFSCGELGVRLFFTVLQPVYLYLFWRVIRPDDADRRDATLFVMLCAATLMLQLYGFIAVPDGPLLMTAALFLLTFKWFSEHRSWAWLWMGIAIAAMAYSKYHGALVVLFVVAANPKQLLRPGLWGAGAVAALLLVPHLWWQYEHDWASFAYHLAGRNKAFSWSSVSDYLVNLLVVFNPFFVLLYVKAWFAARPQNAVERALKLLPAAFIIFFLISTFRGYVQPQWLIVSTFGLLWTLWTYARRHPRTRRYLMRMGWVTLALLALTRIEMIFNPLGIRFEVFNNQTSFSELTELANGRPIVFRSGYAIAAKYNFYTGNEAYCQPNVYYRTHQWQFRDDDTRYAGRETVVETLADAADTTGRVQSVVLPNGYRFNYFVEPHFTPVRHVNIAFTGLSRQVVVGDTLHLELKISNPYSYAVDVDGKDIELRMLWKRGRQIEEFPVGLRFALPAQGTRNSLFDFVVPEMLPDGKYEVGFALCKPGYTYWFNSKTLPVELVR